MAKTNDVRTALYLLLSQTAARAYSRCVKIQQTMTLPAEHGFTQHNNDATATLANVRCVR